MAPLLLAGALPAAPCAAWLSAIGMWAAEGGARHLPPTLLGGGHSTSCLLAAVPGLDFPALLHTVAQSALRPWLQQALGPALACDVDQCWLRPGRPAHQWHQDGALRFDFGSGDTGDGAAMLEMLTCWLPLTPCGAHAPGIEWVDADLRRLLPPAELTDDAVLARFGAAARVRPVMQPGDALLFDGALLHRTHLTPSMAQPRCSIELRFFAADRLPARLAADRFVTVA